MFKIYLFPRKNTTLRAWLRQITHKKMLISRSLIHWRRRRTRNRKFRMSSGVRTRCIWWTRHRAKPAATRYRTRTARTASRRPSIQLNFTDKSMENEKKINLVSSSQAPSFKLGDYNLLPNILTFWFTNRVKFDFRKSYLPSNSYTITVINSWPLCLPVIPIKCISNLLLLLVGSM